MRTKIVKEYIDHGLGFPVKLTNVTMVYARGEWMPRLAYKAIEKQVALVLSRLARPLTGDEVRFLRHYFSMTLTQFAAHFGVSHVGGPPLGRARRPAHGHAMVHGKGPAALHPGADHG